MEIYKKLAAARGVIKAMPVKKAGKNTYFTYFTPEQIGAMVYEAERHAGLIHLFNLEREGADIVGRLQIIDIETCENITFTQVTAIPAITATNAAQQIGGAVTYTKRYMLMTAYDIADNSLDFDARDNSEAAPAPAKAKSDMPDERFKKMIAYIRGVSPEDAARQIADVRKKFSLTEAQECTLIEWEDNL
jgi:hypothetical protein